MKLEVIQPKIKTNPNILYFDKPYYSNWSVTVVIKGLSIIHLVVKNKEGGGRGGLFEREGLKAVWYTWCLRYIWQEWTSDVLFLFLAKWYQWIIINPSLFQLAWTLFSRWVRGKRANSWLYFVACYFNFYSLTRNSLFLLFWCKRAANDLTWARESRFFSFSCQVLLPSPVRMWEKCTAGRYSFLLGFSCYLTVYSFSCNVD